MEFGERNGYKTFIEDGREIFTHRRALENKLGRPIPSHLEVHHINHDKQDNRHVNLVAITRGIHARIHNGYPDACYRCGRDSHLVEDCFANSDYAGNPIVGYF